MPEPGAAAVWRRVDAATRRRAVMVVLASVAIGVPAIHWGLPALKNWIFAETADDPQQMLGRLQIVIWSWTAPLVALCFWFGISTLREARSAAESRRITLNRLGGALLLCAGVALPILTQLWIVTLRGMVER